MRGKSAQGLVFPPVKRGQWFSRLILQMKEGRGEGEGVAQEGVAFEESQKRSPKVNLWEEVRFGKRKRVFSWGGSLEGENCRDAAV